MRIGRWLFTELPDPGQGDDLAGRGDPTRQVDTAMPTQTGLAEGKGPSRSPGRDGP